MRLPLAALLLVAAATPLRAQPAPVEAAPADGVDRLRVDVERLQRELDEERRARKASEVEAQRLVGEARAAADEAARASAKATETANKAAQAVHALPAGLGLRRGDFELRFSGLLQADVVAWRQSSVDEISPATGEPLNQTRFVLRRARLRADLEYKWLAGAFELDANTVRGSTVRVLNGWVAIRWLSRVANAPPYLALTVGLTRIPFGYELRERSKDRFFLERSNVVQALFPSAFDLGAVLWGGWRFLRYSVAAMNGQPVNDAISGAQFQARDPNQSKDFLGRIGADTAFARRFTIAGGVSALYGTGFHAGSPGTKDVLVWRDADENGIVSLPEIQVIAGKSGSPSVNFDRYAVGADLRFTVDIPRLGELALYGELIWGANLDRGRVPSDPIASGRALRQFGWYLAATLELTRWAQIGLRYDTYNPDADTAEQIGFVVVPRDSSFSTVAAAVAVRIVPYGRLLIEYDHNRNHIGRDQSGFPARLADDALTLRAQVQF